MALKENVNYRGITLPESYIKISKVSFFDIKGRDGKEYFVNITADRFANENKQGSLETIFVEERKVKELDLNYAGFYGILKEKFKDAVDA